MAESATQKRGGKALQASIKGLRTSRKKIESAIAVKKIQSKSYKKEMREKARVSRKLVVSRERKALYDASKVVVSAPTIGDINAVKQLIKKVEQVAVAGATWKAGFKLVKTLATDAGKLGQDVKIKK